VETTGTREREGGTMATTKTSSLKFEVHRLTGSTLSDGSGRSMGNESAGVVGRHRTIEAAQRRIDELSSIGIDSPRNYEIRDRETGEPVGE
jgi:hypothetical protein